MDKDIMWIEWVDSKGMERWEYPVCPRVLRRQELGEENNMKKFWLCYVEGTDIHGGFYRHSSLPHAADEAERLARLPNVRGKAVYVFECKGKCTINTAPVIWTGIE